MGLKERFQLWLKRMIGTATHASGESCMVCGNSRKTLYFSHISDRYYCSARCCQRQRGLHEQLLCERDQKSIKN